jgi:hypothetical protein
MKTQHWTTHPAGGLAMNAARSIKYTVGKPMPGTRWVVRGKLGQGGMGLVLHVVKEGVIQGAMKVLHPHFAKLPEFAARFLDEVKVTARLQHRHIVQVLDFDRLGDGTPFMVMERLQGRTLGAALREARQAGKSWTAANAYTVASQVAEGLYRAHSHVPSIVHRDVKPDNLYLHRAESSFDSIVKVMDFGVAAVVGEREQRAIGTPRYMAPEQVTGAALSPQTDQYALGLVIYEMLTGRLPWDLGGRDALALAEERRRVAPAPPSRFCPWLPERMEAALLKALSQDPAARHDTVHGLMFELRGLQSVNDRSPSGADDNHSTVPMVGTLAEGALVVRDDHDTFVRMTAPTMEGGEAAALTGASGISVDVSEIGASAAVADSASPRDDSTREPPSALEAPDASALSEGAEGAAPAGSPCRDTPMTGESVRGAELSRRDWLLRSGAGRRALALAGSAAVVVALLSAAVASSSRGSGPKAVKPVESLTLASASLAPGESASGPPAQSPPESIDARHGVAQVAVPAWLAAHDPTPAGVTSAQPEAGASAVRKAAALRPRPVLRSAPVKAPDDGRDELYVPEAR